MSVSIPRNIPTLDEAFNDMLGGSPKAPQNDIVHIPFSQLIYCDKQNYRMHSHDDLLALSEDIKVNGVLSPANVRPLKDGNYEVLAGRNRTEGAKLAGLPDMPCIVKEVDDTHAALIVHGSNLITRHNLSPSEKAYGYAAYNNALVELNGATSSRTTSYIAQITGEDRRSVQRYIRLSHLNDKLLALVDAGRIQMLAGVELSFLKADSQYVLYEYLKGEAKQKINIKQALSIRDLEKSTDGELQISDIEQLFKIPVREPIPTIKIDAIENYLPEDLPNSQRETYIIRALKFYKENKGG